MPLRKNPIPTPVRGTVRGFTEVGDYGRGEGLSGLHYGAFLRGLGSSALTDLG